MQNYEVIIDQESVTLYYVDYVKIKNHRVRLPCTLGISTVPSMTFWKFVEMHNQKEQLCKTPSESVCLGGSANFS